MKGTFPQPVPIPDLTRPNFGDKDEEVAITQSNIALAEGKHLSRPHLVKSWGEGRSTQVVQPERTSTVLRA